MSLHLSDKISSTIAHMVKIKDKLKKAEKELAIMLASIKKDGYSKSTLKKKIDAKTVEIKKLVKVMLSQKKKDPLDKK